MEYASYVRHTASGCHWSEKEEINFPSMGSRRRSESPTRRDRERHDRHDRSHRDDSRDRRRDRDRHRDHSRDRRRDSSSGHRDRGRDSERSRGRGRSRSRSRDRCRDAAAAMPPPPRDRRRLSWPPTVCIFACPQAEQHSFSAKDQVAGWIRDGGQINEMCSHWPGIPGGITLLMANSYRG